MRKLKAHLFITSVVLLVGLFGGTARGVVWYPQNTNVSDTSPYSTFTLGRKGGTGWIGLIECRSSVSGHTPISASQLTLTMTVSNCTTKGGLSGLPVTVLDGTATARLVARKTTWSRYLGTTTGGGDVTIVDSHPPEYAYVFQVKFGKLVDCTIRTYISQDVDERFFLYPNWYSTPKPAVWGINQLLMGTDVVGPTAANCASNGSWFVDTWYPETTPYLEILEY